MMNTIGKYALICSAFLLCSLEMFAAFGKGEANCIPQVASNVGAKVYVNKNAGYNSGLGNSATNSSWNTKTDFTFYFYADDPAFSNDYTTNYLWDGWYQENTKLSEGDVNDHHMYPGVIRATSSIAWAPTTLKLDAHWVQAVVNSANNTNKTIQDPIQNVDLPITYNVTNAKDVSNFEVGNVSSPFASQSTSWSDNTYTWTLSYKPTGIHGNRSTNAQLTSKYGGTSQTATATVVEDYTPTFSVSTPTFGSIEAGSNTTCDITPSRDTYASQHGTWTAQITGDANGVFALNSISAEGVCAVTFAPQAVGTFSATLQLTCTYTDAAGTPITYTKDVPLSATATPMQNPQLTLNNVASNPGLYTAGSPALYQYPEQYGTVTKTAEFALSYALLNGTPTWSWSDNASSIFAIQQGTATTNGIGISTLPITISAHANTAVTAETTYTATLTIEGNSAKGTLTQQIQVSVTIQPKKKNTLAWALDIWNANSYVLYSDQKNQPAFKDRNNTATPIVFSSSQKDLANYIQIDTAACTLSPKLAANSRNLKATQAESDEYEGTTLTTTIHVRKHDLVWTYPQTDWARGTGQRLYRNTYYANILSTNSIDAGEATGFSEFRYNGAEPALGQTLIDNGDGTYGLETGDLTGNLPFVVNIPETDNYYGRVNTTSTAVWFYIIKDPIHVPVSLETVSKFTSGVHNGEWYGLWLNNANDMYGSTFKVSENKATWIGHDWKNNAWTGENTGRTDWTTVAGQGSTKAFAIENGGSVVFQFRGEPWYTQFDMYFQTSTPDGTVTVEESVDGITWTTPYPHNQSATYLSTVGNKILMMKASRYVRLSYTGNNWVVIRNLNISENTYIRTNFTVINNWDKNHTCTTANNEITKNADGTWRSFDFTLRVANWGKNGIQWTTDNPDFELEFTQPTGTGLDEYREIPAKVRYKGDKYFDQGTLKVFTRDFYGKAGNDTLRSLTFTVKAIGTGTSMPQTITNATKATTYMTGTVGPIRNSATELRETGYMYSATRGENPSTGLNEQDFTACFGSDGTALFDWLYIFGVTTNNDGTTENYITYYKDAAGSIVYVRGTCPKITNAGNVASNAVTPCYIYQKNGDQYELRQTIPNMNVPDKPIGTITTGGKYYFSGHCPSASAGYRASDMGVLHFKGSNTTNVHIYLENCNIVPRAKSQNGSSTPELIEYEATGLTSYQFIEGSGGVIVLQSTSTSSPFAPQIHIKGENYLKSNLGCRYSAVLGSSTVAGPGNQSAAPLHIYTTKEKIQTTLTIDDLWPSTYTDYGSTHLNGELRLRKQTNQSPSIDLGNPNSVINFNGGRISLHNALPTSTSYVTTQAISCRKYVKEIKFILTVTATLYGVGGDYDGGTVHFNDGTISVLPMSLGTDAEIRGYYRDSVSIKCPSNTYVDGGSYISSIWACSDPKSLGASPTNQWGDAVVSHLLPVQSEEPTTGLATVVFPSDLKNIDENDTYFDETLEEYYLRKGKDYGRASITANDTNYVQLLLPAKYTGKEAEQEKILTPWALSTTIIEVGANGYSQAIGGDKRVAYSEKEETNYLLWAQIDNNIRGVASDKSYKTPILPNSGGINVEGTLESIGDLNYANFTNTEDYAINTKLYMMRTVQADTWFSMVAPFDINHIYVIDTYPYSELKKMNRSDALHQQGTANMDLAYFIASPIEANGESTQDLDLFITNFLRYGYGQDTTSGVYPKTANTDRNGLPYYPTYYTQAKGYTTKYRGQNELNHFTGTNYDADYYLYHSKNKTWAYDGTNFTTDWEVVTPVTKNIGDKERSVIMQQGEIYALQFPYCPGCDDVNNRSYFDYWTGKFILFEGFGPQTIKGTNAHEEAFSPYKGTNSGVLRGNTTFATMQQVPNANAYFNTSANVFKPGIGEEVVEPTGVFMLANASAPRAISAVHMRTGDITYIDETDQTGTPTISGGKHLLVATDEGSLTLIPTEPQQVYIYSAAGKLIADRYIGEEWQLSLPAGIYMVRGAYDTAKVVIR